MEITRVHDSISVETTDPDADIAMIHGRPYLVAEGQWFFFDEGGMECGPYESSADAQTAEKSYGRWLSLSRGVDYSC